MWDFIRAVVEKHGFSINDVLDTDYDALIKVVTGSTKKRKKVHTLFEFIEEGGNG